VLINKFLSIDGSVQSDQPVIPFTSTNDSGYPDIKPKLTLRQVEILSHIAGGLSDKEISDELCISVATIKPHVASVFEVLNVSNRTKAAQTALRLRL